MPILSLTDKPPKIDVVGRVGACLVLARLNRVLGSARHSRQGLSGACGKTTALPV